MKIRRLLVIRRIYVLNFNNSTFASLFPQREIITNIHKLTKVRSTNIFAGLHKFS